MFRSRRLLFVFALNLVVSPVAQAFSWIEDVSPGSHRNIHVAIHRVASSQIRFTISFRTDEERFATLVVQDCVSFDTVFSFKGNVNGLCQSSFVVDEKDVSESECILLVQKLRPGDGILATGGPIYRINLSRFLGPLEIERPKWIPQPTRPLVKGIVPSPPDISVED